MQKFTMNNFTELLEMENNFSSSQMEKLEIPSEAAVANILAYSKAVSIKKINSTEPMVIVLN